MFTDGFLSWRRPIKNYLNLKKVKIFFYLMVNRISENIAKIYIAEVLTALEHLH